MTAKTNATVMENKDVRKLLKLMRDNNAPTMTDFTAMLGQVAAMEKQLDAAVGELTAMRRDLAEAQRLNHPIKNAMQSAVTAMQGFVSDLRDKLAELKEGIVNGCQKAIEAFKDKGIAALNGIARFFRIKPILEATRKNLNESIRRDDKAISNIEAISKEYHEAGKHLKNVGRAIIGKEALQEAKPIGALAKGLTAPFKMQRKSLSSMKKHVEAMISSVSRLEERAAERKPSIKKTLAECSKKVEQDKREMQPAVRARKAEVEL
jgi:predicted nuclease with TOPRIM domain